MTKDEMKLMLWSRKWINSRWSVWQKSRRWRGQTGVGHKLSRASCVFIMVCRNTVVTTWQARSRWQRPRQIGRTAAGTGMDWADISADDKDGFAASSAGRGCGSNLPSYCGLGSNARAGTEAANTSLSKQCDMDHPSLRP